MKFRWLAHLWHMRISWQHGNYKLIHYQQLRELYVKPGKNTPPPKITILRLILILLFLKEIIYSYQTNIIKRSITITKERLSRFFFKRLQQTMQKTIKIKKYVVQKWKSLNKLCPFCGRTLNYKQINLNIC